MREVTVVADRESDIYSAFARRPPGVHLLVRAAQDRALEDGGRLFARLDALEEAGRATLSLPAKPGRPAREATLAVRHGRFDLARPRNGAVQNDPSTIAVHLVDVREIDPPPGENVHWRPITTRPVDLTAHDLFCRACVLPRDAAGPLALFQEARLVDDEDRVVVRQGFKRKIAHDIAQCILRIPMFAIQNGLLSPGPGIPGSLGAHPAGLLPLFSKKAIRKCSAGRATHSCVNSGHMRRFTSRSDDVHNSNVVSMEAPSIPRYTQRIIVSQGATPYQKVL